MSRTSPTLPRNFGDFELGLRRRVGAGLLGQVPARRGGGDRQPAGVGRRLLLRDRLADRRGRPHLRRRSGRSRCWSTQARGQRQGPGGLPATSPSRASGTARRRSSSPTQATTLLESTRAIDPAAADRPAAGPQRPEHAARAAAGHRRGAARRTAGDSEGARARRRGRARRDAAPPPRHPQRGAASRPRSAPASASPRPSSTRASRCSAASACAAIGTGAAARNLFSTSSIFYSAGPAGELADLQLRPADERRPRRGRALPAAARQLPRHGPAGRRRRWRTR